MMILLRNQITGVNVNICANFYLQTLDLFVIPEANLLRTTAIQKSLKARGLSVALDILIILRRLSIIRCQKGD